MDLAGAAREITVRVDADAPVQLYASSLPTEQQIGSTDTQFTIIPGPYPPSEVVGSIVVRGIESRDAVSLTLTAETTFDRTSSTAVVESNYPSELSIARWEERWTTSTSEELVP